MAAVGRADRRQPLFPVPDAVHQATARRCCCRLHPQRQSTPLIGGGEVDEGEVEGGEGGDEVKAAVLDELLLKSELPAAGQSSDRCSGRSTAGRPRRPRRRCPASDAAAVGGEGQRPPPWPAESSSPSAGDW